MEIYPGTPFGLPDTAPDVARRFAMILAGLGALVARRFLRMPHLSGFTLLLFSRLHRAVRRFYRALTRPAGKARAPRVRVDRNGDVRARAVALPSGRGWIVRELGWEAAAYKAYLEALVAETGTLTALEARPGLGRILRPICRMLGVVMPVVAARAVLLSAEAVVDLGVVSAQEVGRVWPEVDAGALDGEAVGDWVVVGPGG